MKLYDTLGIDKNASQADIKKAFKKKASKTHPDKEGGDTEAFKELQRCYAILSDPQRKERYDSSGDEGQFVGKDAAIKSSLSQIFLMLIQQEKRGDLVQLAREHINGEIAKAETNKRQAKSRIAVFEKKLNRIIVKKGINLFEDVIKQQIDALNRGVQGSEDFIDAGNKMLELLADYEDTRPEKDEQNPYLFTAAQRDAFRSAATGFNPFK